MNATTSRRRRRRFAPEGPPPDGGRRRALAAGGGASLLGLLAAAGWFASGETRAAEPGRPAFAAKSLADAVRALGGTAPAVSRLITFHGTPDIADNGASVPVGVASALPKTESIAIVIEKNPNVLAAEFEIPPGTEPTVSIRVKMAQSSNVHALVRADGRYHVATREIRVTQGGCIA